jgi:hypothetical protein
MLYNISNKLNDNNFNNILKLKSFLTISDNGFQIHDACICILKF